MRTKNIYPTQIVIKRTTKKAKDDSDVEAFLKSMRHIANVNLSLGGGREILVGVSTPVRIGNGDPFYPNSIILNISAILYLRGGKSFEVNIVPDFYYPHTEFNIGSFASFNEVITDVDVVTREWNTVVDEHNSYTFSKYKISETVRDGVFPSTLVESLLYMQSWYQWNTNDVLSMTISNRIVTIKAGPNFPTGTVNGPLTIITDNN